MNAVTHTLERELGTFRRILPTLSGEEGRFALIAGDELLGSYDTYADALQAGYAKRGLEPFLVKQIIAVEVAANFSRTLRAA